MGEKKILIVDNNLVMVKLMTNYLDKQGHHTRVAHNGFEALDLLSEFTPDVIYLDLVMPRLSGDKLCRLISNNPHLKHCYIVIISATLAEQEIDLKELGADTAIIKGPFREMSIHIDRTLMEADGDTPSQYDIKGLGSIAPRAITRELLCQNSHLQKLIESLSQGIIELEGTRVLYLNTAAETILGLEKATILGRYLDQGLSDEVWQQIAASISNQQTKTGENDRAPVNICSKQVIISSLLLDQNSDILILLLTDITTQKRMEAVVEATNLTENLGYIFSGIRHEIGNPVNSIKMALTVLQKNLTTYDLDTIEEFVARSLEEIARLEYLLKALKNYSLFEKPVVADIAMQPFMENFLHLISDDLKQRNVILEKQLGSKPLVAKSDSRALHQVLLNIVINALDAVEQVDSPSITISLQSTTSRVKIIIEDNGPGIPEEDQAKLFTPFFTTKPQGTGLGLVIVQKMLRSMNSSLAFNSDYGQGTSVTISLPRKHP